MGDLVKVTVHMKDVANCDKMNTVYESFFDDYPSARMTMQSPPPLGFWSTSTPSRTSPADSR
jgi:2-iminobutanoate/2-iminopropanoate deaminase